MIKQVYMVQVNERIGYADTLEKASKLEETFKASYCAASDSVTNLINEYKK